VKHGDSPETGSRAVSPYPLFLTPHYQDYVWGGGLIREQFLPTAPEGRIAEAWLVSDREEGASIIENGPFSGETLHHAMMQWGADVFASVISNRFPLLIKLLDAKQTLSVQVHPNDDTAAAVGGEAKSEAWVVLHADQHACVYWGFKTSLTPEALQVAAKQGHLPELMHRIPVKSGDVIMVPGGTVHAIGAGCLIFEVQQNSNTTYRLFDWLRTDAQGHSRTLHLSESLAVADLTDRPPQYYPASPCSQGNQELLHSPWFSIDTLSGPFHEGTRITAHTTEILFGIEGSTRFSAPGTHETITPGRVVLIPSSIKDYLLSDVSNLSPRLLRIRIPSPCHP